jgi:hypothetical protein
VGSREMRHLLLGTAPSSFFLHLFLQQSKLGTLSAVPVAIAKEIVRRCCRGIL